MGKKGKGRGGGNPQDPSKGSADPPQGQQQPQGPQQGQGQPRPQGPQQGQGQPRPQGPQQGQGQPRPQGPQQGQGQPRPQGPQQGQWQARPQVPQQGQGQPRPQGPQQGQWQARPQGPQQGQGRGRPPGPQQGRGRGLPQGPQQEQGHPPGQSRGRGHSYGAPPGAPPTQTQQDPGPPQGPGSSGPSQGEQLPPGPPHVRPITVQEGQGDSRQPPRASNVESISQTLSHVTMNYSIPTRADKARLKTPARDMGKPIPLEVNHLLVKFKPASQTENIYHYDTVIDPDRPKRLLRSAVEAARQLLFPTYYPAFDGRRNMYNKGPLPIKGNEESVQVKVADDERADKEVKTFKVTFKLARSFPLNPLFDYQRGGASTCPPQDVIQALDVVLRSGSARTFVQVGRSFFCPPDRPQDLGNGLELWLGFFQSFILGQRPYLNIDVAHKGFPRSQCVYDLLVAMAGNRDKIRDYLHYQSEDFKKFIRGLKVTYEIPGNSSSKRVYRVNTLVKNAVEERFEHDGKTMCIGEYFEKEKRYRIRDPHVPCVHVGSKDKTIYVPMELLTIVGGQATMKKMDEIQTANMVKIAATNVADRKRKIKEAMQRANINQSPEVMQFGLSVDQEFAKVTGHILPAPPLQYNNRVVMPAKGVWRSGLFVKGVELSNWVMVDATGRLHQNDAKNFEQQMIAEGRNLNMNISGMQNFISVRRERNPQVMNNTLQKHFNALKDDKVALAVVVIGSRDPAIYSIVKTAAELHSGFLTQCVKDFTLQRKMNQSTVHNILLKVNSKLNGLNHTLQREPVFLNRECAVLVIGADVTHPSPDSRDIPSVAAVTASHDMNGFQYNPQIRLQPPRVEIIVDLENIVYEQLRVFRNRTNSIPRHIIFYRDGVSEGQFTQVLEQELAAIHRACTRCNKGYKPHVTFLVVQKRHHTRFFPLRKEDSNDRNGNVPAGTIVDTDICHPTEIDFYLVSHASIQGVARPTKYHVLWDDSSLSESDIKLLTYGLCHLFTRCDRAVSYPAPTYYAHLAAARGRVYLENMTVNLENLAREEKRIQNIIHERYPMFFV